MCHFLWGFLFCFEDRMQIPETKECCFWRGAAEVCVTSCGDFWFCFEDGMQIPETKECCYWRGTVCFTSCGFPPSPPLFVCLLLFVLMMECRYLKQKSVGWRKGLFLYLWVFCCCFLKMECRYLKQKSVASGEGWRRGLCHFLWDFVLFLF